MYEYTVTYGHQRYTETTTDRTLARTLLSIARQGGDTAQLSVTALPSTPPPTGWRWLGCAPVHAYAPGEWAQMVAAGLAKRAPSGWYVREPEAESSLASAYAEV